MKKKVLLSSVMTIVLCLCLIAGSTFALFTAEDQFDISVTSGNVEIDAFANITKLYSADGSTGNYEDDFLVDEYGNNYEHKECTGNTFYNGGTADLSGHDLVIKKITPGDRVDLNIEVINTSNVAISYRYIIEVASGKDLATGMAITVDGNTHEAVQKYTSEWAFADPAAAIPAKAISIELPVYAGNEYKNLTDLVYTVKVEAIQSNAVTKNEAEIVYYRTATDSDSLKALLESSEPAIIDLSDDFVDGGVVTANNVSDKEINANGKDVSLVFTGTIENVVVSGIVDNDGIDGSNMFPINVKGAVGDITVKDSKLGDLAGGGYGAIAVGKDVDVTVDGCEISAVANSSGSTKGYGVYGGSCGDLTITNTKFVGFGSWAVLINGTIYGNLVIDNCEFIDCVEGIAKAGVGAPNTSGTVEGNFIFTNNTLVNCLGHDKSEAKMFTVTYQADAVIDNNTRDGADFVPDSTLGVVKAVTTP